MLVVFAVALVEQIHFSPQWLLALASNWLPVPQHAEWFLAFPVVLVVQLLQHEES